MIANPQLEPNSDVRRYQHANKTLSAIEWSVIRAQRACSHSHAEEDNHLGQYKAGLQRGMFRLRKTFTCYQCCLSEVADSVEKTQFFRGSVVFLKGHTMVNPAGQRIGQLFDKENEHAN